ncbi:MAG TPA: DUF1648 domain-containing protein [Longimicrobium sp.]|nr:DUF1648 domain-containing protein [Longimicrobium sp.]
MTTQRYRLLNAILILALFAGSAWAYPHLPERIPVHFGFSGQPDAWAGRSIASWFLLPAITAALALMMHAMAAAGASSPHLWNLPEKRRFLALPRTEQAPIIARMQRFIALIAVVATLLLGAIQAGIYRASTGNSQGLPAWVLGWIFASVLVIGIAAYRLNSEVGSMVREAHGRAIAQ